VIFNRDERVSARSWIYLIPGSGATDPRRIRQEPLGRHSQEVDRDSRVLIADMRKKLLAHPEKLDITGCHRGLCAATVGRKKARFAKEVTGSQPVIHLPEKHVACKQHVETIGLVSLAKQPCRTPPHKKGRD
jgi:hypothetical protein